MDFFGIGPWELILILIVALIVVGPGKIPEIARTLGKTVRAIRKASSELTTAVSKELEAAEKSEKTSKAEKATKAALPAKKSAARKSPAKKSAAANGPTKQGEAPRTQ